MIAMKSYAAKNAALLIQGGVLLFLAVTFGLVLQDKLLIQINPKVADVRVENVIDTSFMNKLESSGFIQSVYKKH
jgi:hypothetical protein